MEKVVLYLRAALAFFYVLWRARRWSKHEGVKMWGGPSPNGLDMYRRLVLTRVDRIYTIRLEKQGWRTVKR